MIGQTACTQLTFAATRVFKDDVLQCDVAPNSHLCGQFGIAAVAACHGFVRVAQIFAACRERTHRASLRSQQHVKHSTDCSAANKSWLVFAPSTLRQAVICDPYLQQSHNTDLPREKLDLSSSVNACWLCHLADEDTIVYNIRFEV